MDQGFAGDVYEDADSGDSEQGQGDVDIRPQALFAAPFGISHLANQLSDMLFTADRLQIPLGIHHLLAGFLRRFTDGSLRASGGRGLPARSMDGLGGLGFA